MALVMPTSLELMRESVEKPRVAAVATMPLTVGPGSISVAITLGANPSGSARALVMTFAGHAVGLAIVALTIYIVYSKADVVLAKLGRTGALILTRMSAFILLCVGVQIVWNGVRALLKSL